MSGALAMFSKRTKDGDIKKSAQKVSDHKKDAITRLKHLRHVLDNYSVPEAKAFFDANYSHIYYIFTDNFASVEADLKQRANRAHKEELDGILQIFEKILVLLPELVHKRWMFHSIGRVLKKLLHPGNVLKIRKDGMRLFLIWYQILQDNASDECHDIFLQLVQGLGDGVHQDVLYGRVAQAEDSCSGMIAAGEILPILPSSGEKYPDNITRFFFDSLIYYMVSEVTKVEWLNAEMRRSSFIFLFDKFKSKYLQWLLPDFDPTKDIYNPVLPTPVKRKMSELKSKDLPANVAECRYSYIKWLAHFVLISKQEKATDDDGTTAMAEASVPDDDSTDLTDHRSNSADHMPGSNASTLSTASHTSDQDSTTSSLCYEEFGDADDIVRSVLYMSRENINILHESFRQALLFTFRQGKAISKVIGVYKDWFQHAEQAPVFMQEPSELGTLPLGQRDTPEFHHSSLSDIVEEENSSDESAPYARDLVRSLASLESSDKSRIRNASYLGAIQDLADGGETQNLHEVQAGIQKVLQVFIVNSANVFLLEADEEDFLSEQVDICKKALNIYRSLVMEIKMEQKTWEKLLEILLCITSGVLSNLPNSGLKHKTLGGRLATNIFQTVIVTWIKANLDVLISQELWDRFQQVLSSLTAWSELIAEWAKTMETLTRLLAKHVYNLDLNDLPLQKLSERKEIRRRGRSQDMPKKKVNDKSFSRGWSKSESQSMAGDKTTSLTSAGVPFERGKYKSDGAGGGKSRPDLTKQRSLSGEPSPSHSRQPSNASDSALYIRRSSDGADPSMLVERLKGIHVGMNGEGLRKSDSPVLQPCPSISISNTTEATNTDGVVPEDAEVSRITMASLETSSATQDGYNDYSGDSVSLDKSDQDNTFRFSHSSSPASLHSRSPSPTSELTVSIGGNKDCPTPDRDSLHIDMVAAEDAPITEESTEDLKSVLAGGTVTGFMPDNTVVLWRRMLGSLGNINRIEDPENHAAVHEVLESLLGKLNKIRENLGVSLDNNSTPAPPELIPPLFMFAPWLFECLSLSNKYKRGKLQAYELLCKMVVQRHDIMLPSELLSQFYMTLHQGLCSNDQDIISTIIRYCGSRFFSMPLHGSSLLVKDMIVGSGSVLSAVDMEKTPRTEAMAILGSLICFPNHYQELQVLDQSGLTISYLCCNEFKEMVLNYLLRAGKKEPASQRELARCVSLNGIGVFLYEELTHNTLHPKLNEAFIVLLGSLRCTNRQVAKIASDVLSMLSDHADKLLSYHPQLPKLIIEVVAGTISIMLPQSGSSPSEEERKLMVSMMFCMVEWCMRMPVSLLLETSDTDRSTLYKVFTVLDLSVKGHTLESLNAARQSLSGMIQDSDFEHLRDISSSHRRSCSDSMLQTITDHFSDKSVKQEEKHSIQLAAKTMMNHLVNHYCHFPMGAGASRLSSAIQEHHDLDDPMEDLRPEIFDATNIQFFVQNKRTLISLIELPAMLDLPGGGVTAGLTTARTVSRVILRDLTGKYSWESAVLFAPPWCKQGSSTFYAKALLDQSTEEDTERLIIEEEGTRTRADNPAPTRDPAEFPMFDMAQPQHDNLNHMLRYIGHTSTECLLIPGEPLNIEAPIPVGLSGLMEEALQDNVIQQKDEELDYYAKHKYNKRHLEMIHMLAQPQMPAEVQEYVSPFQMCRMMLDQMGLLAWEKRCHFDLLKKSEKLLRELKNLDNQKCRETHKFAVIYVAEGQEDKNSILSNYGGSKAFEDFVAGLGWEVELEMHQGFMGGLQQNKTTGDTAPYYATSLVECIFHVSTRMPSGTDEARHIKMRHLGNDEVHIVWSEHTRDYRRGIIPTEFGDVLIIIYPLPCGLYRIQIDRKEVPYFGPLFDGAIVDRKVLPGLVRATAINASRVKRLSLPYYHSFYEERAKCFEAITQQHIDYSMFEEFAAKIFAPVLPQNSTISDSTTDLPPSASSSSLNHAQQSTEQVSPSTTRNRGSESGNLSRNPRRFSLRGRKSSASKSSQTAGVTLPSAMVTPPSSPDIKTKKQ